jgi:long-subunit fatty acid transport protein
VGAAVGLASFRYTSFEQTNERGKFRFNNQDTDYNVDYNRNFDTEGSGLNLKLGLILKPVNELRIGLSFETPTYFNVTDNYSEDLINNIDAIKGTDAYPFEYRLSTPVKANGGLAYFFGDKGFISADVGFVDYTSIKFSSGDSSTDLATNRNSRQDFQNVINYSLGGELRVQPNLMLRLGYQVQGNPYKNLSNTDFEIKSISGGFGYRFGSYYLDMSLVNSNDKLFYRNYSLENGSEPVANIDTKRNNVNLTFGVRF